MPYLSRISSNSSLMTSISFFSTVQNAPQIRDLSSAFPSILSPSRRNLQIRQAIQLQGKNRIRLPFGESKFRDQIILRILTVFRCFDRCDNFIQNIQRLDKPFQHMGTVFRFLQIILAYGRSRLLSDARYRLPELL